MRREGDVTIAQDGQVFVELTNFNPGDPYDWERLERTTHPTYVALARRYHVMRSALEQVAAMPGPHYSEYLKRAVRLAVAALLVLFFVGGNDLDLPVDGRLPELPPIELPAPGLIVPPEDGEPEPSPTFYGEPLSAGPVLCFVVDVSGSMSCDVRQYQDGDQVRYGDRLDRAKTELVRCILSLPESYEFDVLAYDCSSSLWAVRPRRAEPDAKADAVRWVRALQPGGGTGTGDAVAQALNFREVRQVVLLTDGDPNCYLNSVSGSRGDPEEHRRAIRLANAQGATVDVFGIGAYGQFRAFCEAVATDNSGTYVDVP